MKRFIQRHKVGAGLASGVLIVLLAVSIYLNPALVKGSLDILGGSSSTPVQTPNPYTAPVYAPAEVLDLFVDTPPDENAQTAHAVLAALAGAIDTRCHENAGKLVVYIHYLLSRSYLADAGSFAIPAIDKFPPPPLHNHSDDLYKQSKYDKDYTTAMHEWQQTITRLRKQVTATCTTAHQETNRLRALPLPYDGNGADLYGGLLEAAHHFQHARGMKKELVIISSLVNTTTQQSTGPFLLTGVQVMFLGRTCIQQTASACEQTASFWKKFLYSIGVTHIDDVDPEQVPQVVQTVI